MDSSKVKCEVCGKEFKAISRTHLITHDMTMEEYRMKFPNSPMQSEKTIKKLSTNRVEYWIAKHGEKEGRKKYEEYKQFLGEKNTYEYKKKHHGWSIEEFSKFNKSRAVTLENLCKKHGDVLGAKKYNDYVEKQRYVGVSEEYFVEKLGVIEGKKKYKEINKQKSHTLKTYIKRYGSKKEAIDKLNELHDKKIGLNFSSNLEREFISDLLVLLDNEGIKINKVYSILTNNQFGVWSHNLDKLVKVDLMLYDIKGCIEFNGDFWHCNPNMYTSDYLHPILNKTARDIWDKDKNKIKDIEKQGFSVREVWEYDYRNRKDELLQETLKWIQELKEVK